MVSGRKGVAGALPVCFVMMPIGDTAAYDAGHFKDVYECLFCPAIEAAGYLPKRADDDMSSSMIPVSIIRDIIEAPMAVCDLSTRNPNVLFELGIRQAFDLPVVLVQEVGTPRIFDISTINTIDYHPQLVYKDVLADRAQITQAILDTAQHTGVNSIIRLLELTKRAELSSANRFDDGEDITFLLMHMSNQLRQIQNEIHKA